MKSIRTKIMFVVLTAVVLTGVFLTAVSIHSVDTLSQKDSDLLLEYICKQNESYINSNLDSTEQVLGSIYYYALENIAANGKKFTRNKIWRDNFIDKIEDFALTEYANSREVQAMYFRVNTDIDPTGGFLYQYYGGTGELKERIRKPIDEDETVSIWYYQPRDTKEAMWIGPYDNYDLKMRTISYVIPFYLEDRFLGVFGMDIDVSTVALDLSKIRLYSSGSAILFDRNDNIVFHKSHVRGLAKEKFSQEQNTILEAAKLSAEENTTKEYNRNTKLYAIRLNDGMLLCVMAPIDEINETQSQTIRASVLTGIIILCIVSLAALFIVNNFLQPLHELSRAASELSDGNMDVEIKEYPHQDEIGELSRTFAVMAHSLKKYFDHFHGLAYTDNMTGLNNKAAFETVKEVIESEIAMGRASFGIVVMDVNNLKLINDSIGHEKGDELLKHTAGCMRQAFTGFPLYRIGGDEFVSVINADTPGDELITLLQEITAEKSEEDYPDFKIHYQIAAGCAFYSSEREDSFSDVFNRADQAMYVNKRKLKGDG